MLVPNTTNFVYYSNTNEKSEKSSPEISSEKTNLALKTMAKQILKEKTPSVQDLQSAIEKSMNGSLDEQQKKEGLDKIGQDSTSDSIIIYLKNLGYLKDDKKWLTKKAFFEIGQKLLEDVIKAINEGESGFHETRNIGAGDTILDTSRRLELGNDLKHLDAAKTLLNIIQRKKSRNESLDFPLQIEFEDFEEFETREEIKVSVVYCIDLSYTMKYSLSSGEGTRIEAAKKALWALYVLNKKFFPNDSIYIIGFGSLASKIDPHDIPYLRTYDANDNFLHYTNYQAALRLAIKILKKDGSQNKRIVLITDGQPSASFVDSESQKKSILDSKPYSHFYKPDETTLSKIKNERGFNLDINNSLVYLCYRYKQVDPEVESKTLQEAKKCLKEGIDLDTIMVSEETELLHYVENFEKHLKGRAYYINPEKIDRVLVSDFISNKRKILGSSRI
jgi:uncharacterized protein with von Willebrand factor type A (vWA) domain